MNLLTDPVHFSNLKKLGESPAHYLASIGTSEDKPAYRIGRLTHALVLGVQPGGKWDVYDGRRAGKEWDAFEAARSGVDIFTKTEHTLALAMANSVLRTHARLLEQGVLPTSLLRGETEVPVAWTHESGRKCATRGIDILNRDERFTVELKTAVSSQPERFSRESKKLAYHAQGAWFQDAAKSIGVDVERHYVIAVEKKAPHVVTVFCVTPRAILQGQKLIRSWMELLHICEAANDFPGYAQYIVDLDTGEDEVDLVFEGDEGDDEADDEVAA